MRVGILGGGQLGLMLAEALQRLDAEVRLLDSDVDCPAAQRLRGFVAGRVEDVAALSSFAGGVDVLTFESENIASEPLEALSQARFVPSLEVLQVCQDRICEKGFLIRHGIPCVRHAPVAAGESVREAAKRFGFPAILKTARGGYDGKGQWLLRSEADLPKDLDGAAPMGFVLEEQVELMAELSCIVGRSRRGEEVTFPVFENEHRAHVLDVTLLPARLPREVQDQARRIALQLARAFDLEGLLTIEFFWARSQGRAPALYVNELAPRPHNSGHVTRIATTLSQFDVLARILVGAPLFVPELVAPGAFCMGNLLGDVWLAQGRQALDVSAWRGFSQVRELYLYGKKEPRPKRKMGHFLLHAQSSEEALTGARAFRQALMQRPS